MASSSATFGYRTFGTLRPHCGNQGTQWSFPDSRSQLASPGGVAIPEYFGKLYAGAKLGGEAHDPQDATARRLDWHGGSDADRDDCTDALSFYSFHERRR